MECVQQAPRGSAGGSNGGQRHACTGAADGAHAPSPSLALSGPVGLRVHGPCGALAVAPPHGPAAVCPRARHAFALPALRIGLGRLPWGLASGIGLGGLLWGLALGICVGGWPQWFALGVGVRGLASGVGLWGLAFGGWPRGLALGVGLGE